MRAAEGTASVRLGGITPQRDVLFTYGTLMFPDVLMALLDRVPTFRASSTAGWRAAALKDRVYPGLVASANSVTTGHLIGGLSLSEWQLLDRFEDDIYQLVRLELTDDGRSVWAYVWPDGDGVRTEAWNADQFARCHLPAYAERCAALRQRYLSEAGSDVE